MFSFHKPRVYRSTEGCCICRAKSSSSRFTDSRKYEEDSIKCFDLKHPRYGEICNACVLLVKRYKRLPPGSQRHWGHVVDARAGPGTKTFTKFKRNKDEKSNDNSKNARTNHIHNGKTLITEKFSKIFKKTKKLKSTLVQNNSKTQNSPPRMRNKMTLTKRQHSVESDNENSRESSPGSTRGATPTPTPTQTTVQFQTQTRASSYRKKNAIVKPSQVMPHHDSLTLKRSQKLSGSKRRKKLPPRKNRINLYKEISFFDDTEWKPRLVCCNAIRECEFFGGAFLIDVETFNNCEDHGQKREEKEKSISPTKQNCIKATLPAVVKLNFPLITNNVTPNINQNFNPTPVLKKHHLFFKRQSECFPHGDLTPETTNSINSKTEICVPAANSVITSTTLKTQNEEIIPKVVPLTKPVSFEAPHSKGGSTGFLHRIKSDAGKIVKHSIDKLNSAVRLKAHDLAELKHIIKTVDKNEMTKAPPITITTTTTATAATTKKALEDILPTSSSSSSSSTKFSDNSSDSGFDENVQDRKSVSPISPQQENENKLISCPAVQTLILTGGTKALGQQKNLVYAANDTTRMLQCDNILQGRAVQQKQNLITSTVLKSNKHFNMQPTTIDTLNSIKVVHTANGSKVRAIYNNNAIQHENGITTILPASSFAASSQTAAMQATAPNTITITPALTMQKRIPIPQGNAYKYFYENTNTEDHNTNHHQYVKNSSLNQKFIVLKGNTNATQAATSNFCNNNNTNNSSDVMSSISNKKGL